MAASNEYADHKRTQVSAKTKGKPGLIKIRKSTCAADVRNGAVALALDMAADNRFHYGHGSAAHHNGCYFCGTQGSNKNGVKLKKYSYCCNPFVHACYAHGGGEPTALKICKHGSSWDFNVGQGYDRLAKKGKLFKKIHNPSPSKLLPGDVGCSGHHAKLYVGKWNGKHHICEASGGDDNRIGSSNWNNSIHVQTMSGCGGYRWYRYIGKGGKMMHRLSSTGGSTIPGGSVESKEKANKLTIQAMTAWAKAIAKDQSYKYKSYKDNDTNSHKCPVCHKEVKKGWNGPGFLVAIWKHGGKVKNKCSNGVLKAATLEKMLNAETDAAATTIAKEKLGISDIKVFRNDGKNIKKSSIKEGDLCFDFLVGKLTDSWYYAGKSTVIDCQNKLTNKKDIAERSWSTYSAKLVIRYTGIGAYKVGGGGASGTSGQVSDDGSGIILENEISKLYSSDNYEFVNLNFDNVESESMTRFKSTIQSALDAQFVAVDRSTGAVGEAALGASLNDLTFEVADFQKNKAKNLVGVEGGSLTTYPNLAEAPTIVLDFNGIKIGGHGNSVDYFPNYIDSMSVKKINGRINQYTLNLIYQIRPNEDPNFIDKLLSRVSYTNPMKILYGDSMYPDNYFREEEVYVMDAKHSEDPSSAKITYTISAISSIGASAKSSTTFNATTDKPSNQIYKLLYDSGEVSTSLLNAFPGMQNRQLVASSGLIPNTDAVVNIAGMANTSPTAYLSTLVSSMKNAAGETSSYFLTYNDDSAMNGSYFKISEVKKLASSSNYTGSVYSVDVGYPSDSMVMNFQLSDNTYQSLAYKFAGNINAYEYDIDNGGNIIANKINLINKNSKHEQYNLIDENWWKQVTEFPISAKLTLKGLVTPAMLMSYINVNAIFYGQKDKASGLYVVTEENDTISGNGYRTELTLLRVAED